MFHGHFERIFKLIVAGQILVFGVAPFVWGPITSRFGRYQVLLISVTGTLVCNIGAARCTTYGGMMATRVIASFLISPPLGIGSGVVTDLSEPEHRAQKMGWWTLLLTVGTPSGETTHKPIHLEE